MVEYELSAIDRHFAAFICREAGVAPPWLEIAVSLASNAVGNGNICLNLADLAGRTIRVGGEDVALPPLEELQDGLQRTRVVGTPGDFRPLVLDGGGRLYLYRYWKYEQELARVIIGKAALSSGEI